MSASADTASHASVTSVTLRLLSGIALSSELATVSYRAKLNFNTLLTVRSKKIEFNKKMATFSFPNRIENVA